MRLRSVGNRLRRFWHGLALEVWYDAGYRLPLSGLESHTGFEPRRADLAAWYLLDSGALDAGSLRRPRPATWAELALVHDPEMLDALARPEELARVFAADPRDLPVDELLASIRLAVGGTIEAARSCVKNSPPLLGRRALNLMGGFHHASPDRAAGFCAVNDVAVAVAVLRADGFAGRINVLDLDAHPPDGTAACLRGDGAVWIGSLSGSDWGEMAGVDETLLVGANDQRYLEALEGLLSRMPPAQLCFVLAGGDVLKGDPLGQLELSLRGARQRDLRVAAALLRTPSVWLPAGGYTPSAWRALAGTGMALSLGSSRPIPARTDPLSRHFRDIARTLDQEELGSGDMNMDDVAEQLGMRSSRRKLLLGFYTAQGLEHALNRYGILGELQRLGYGPFRAEVGGEDVGERLRLFGSDGAGKEELLIETMLERQRVAEVPVLYVHWLTLRHPKARFSEARPPLPGQEVPGLGLAREAAELLGRMAVRLELDGVACRPATYHTAFLGRGTLRFVDARRQGRFEALIRDLAGLPLAQATAAVAEGRVLMDGVPYAWEADEMVRWLRPHPFDAAAAQAERDQVHFTVVPAAAAPG